LFLRHAQDRNAKEIKEGKQKSLEQENSLARFLNDNSICRHGGSRKSPKKIFSTWISRNSHAKYQFDTRSHGRRLNNCSGTSSFVKALGFMSTDAIGNSGRVLMKWKNCVSLITSFFMDSSIWTKSILKALEIVIVLKRTNRSSRRIFFS